MTSVIALGINLEGGKKKNCSVTLYIKVKMFLLNSFSFYHVSLMIGFQIHNNRHLPGSQPTLQFTVKLGTIGKSE